MGGGVAAFAMYDRDIGFRRQLKLCFPGTTLGEAPLYTKPPMTDRRDCHLLWESPSQCVKYLRLLHVVNEAYQKHSYDLELFIHCSLDIIDEKALKANEMYLGHLYTDQKYKSFGFVTNTSVKMILVLEANNLDWKDIDIKTLFRRFHILYCNAISNPFHIFGEEIRSKSVLDAAAELIKTHAET